MPKQVVRDPLKGLLEHIDLLLVRRGEKVTVDVPITLVGEAAPETIVDLQQPTLSVEAEATNIPAGLEVSIEGLEVGASIPASQVPLPAGTSLVADPESVVVHVTVEVPRRKMEPLSGEHFVRSGGSPATTCGGS